MYVSFLRKKSFWAKALLVCLCAASLTALWARGREDALAEKLVRLHVLAVSDDPADQARKLQVRDAVLERLGPELASAADAGEAAERLRALLPELERLAAGTSGAEASAYLTREYYPTRRYGGFALPAGRYLSLRILLGEGAGHNWWCVVYPPLCAASAEEAREASALTDEEWKLITEDGAEYAVKFRVLEWWGWLREKLER